MAFQAAKPGSLPGGVISIGYIMVILSAEELNEIRFSLNARKESLESAIRFEQRMTNLDGSKSTVKFRKKDLKDVEKLIKLFEKIPKVLLVYEKD